jgi:alkanesulfonate monooxygenase SsuD/methylene tetrahydromethanopterin reductase-like flavin-dependent oxidoreductase (luciferase family)
MAEEAAQTDIISGGRLRLGVSRGSAEHALNGPEVFGYTPPTGGGQTELAHEHTHRSLQAISGADIADGHPAMGAPGKLPIQPQSPGLAQRIYWGSATRATGRWSAQHGMNLMSSTLLTEDTGIPCNQLQAEQIDVFRTAWAEAGYTHAPLIPVSRSLMPIVNDLDEQLVGHERHSQEQTGRMPEPGRPVARFGRSYAGEPDLVARCSSRTPPSARPTTSSSRFQHPGTGLQHPPARHHRRTRRPRHRLAALPQTLRTS